MSLIRPAVARLVGRPLAIAPRRLDALLAAVAPEGAVQSVVGFEPKAPRDHVVIESGIAVVPVVGPLVSRSDWLSALFGAVSYGEAGDAIEAALADPSARAVLIELDSPGGEVGGLFDLVERISALREDAGKPLWAAASESALSAACAVASAAQRIYVTQTGEVGSVGVVAAHVDESASDAMAGLKWTLIHAGTRKVDGNPHEPLSARAFADIQADVAALHAQLVEVIAANRGLSPDAVRATEAAIYRGARSVEIGFADRVGTLAQAIADLEASLDASRKPIAPARRKPSSSQPARSEVMTTGTPVAESPAEAAAAVADPAPATAAVQPPATPAADSVGPVNAATPISAEALRAEFAEIAAVAAQATRLGVTVDAAEAMRKGTRPDALRRSVLDALAARAEASAVVSATAVVPTAAGESPIIRRAREHAAAARS